MSRTSSHKSKTFKLLLGLSVTAVCLWWAARGILNDPTSRRDLAAAFQTANYLTLIPLWGLLFVFYWLKAWRWRMLLAPLGHFRPMRELFPPTLIGFAFNNLLPAHLGEFVRVYVFARDHRLPRTAVLSSIVLERVFDVIALLAFLAIGLVFAPGMERMDPSVQSSASVFAIAAAGGVAAAFAYVVWTRPFVALAEGCLRLVPGLPETFRGRIAHMLEAGAAGLSSLKSGRLLAGILITSLLQWALNGWMMWIALWSFGIDVSPLVAFILLGVVAFGVTIPSSPGYFGVIQLCFISVLKFFVDDRETVFAASVYYHMAQYVPVTLLGLYYYNRAGLRVADVEHEAEEESQT